MVMMANIAEGIVAVLIIAVLPLAALIAFDNRMQLNKMSRGDDPEASSVEEAKPL